MMNITSPNLRFFLLLFAISLFACETKIDERNNIIAGKWFIEYAEKDGNKIGSLEGTVYDFSADGKINTNVPQIGSGTFSFDDDVLIQKGNSTINYKIEELNAKRLILNAKIKDMQFKLAFTRDSLPQ